MILIKKSYLSILISLHCLVINAQISKEQIAFDYFFDAIAATNYQEAKIKFSGKTETVTTGTLFNVECISKENLAILYRDGFQNASALCLKNEKLVLFNQKNGSNKKIKTSLRIYRSIRLDDFELVLLTVTKKHSSSTFFYIKINNENEIIDWCSIATII